MITSRLIDRNVKFTRLRRFAQEASSSKELLLVAVLAILGALTACGDAHLPLLTSIQVSPANSTIDIGQTQQFTAAGAFSDGSSKDLSNLVTWSSSNTAVAAISSSGLALSGSQGSSIISATFNTADGLVTGAATLNVVVTLKSLTITPVDPSIANSTSLQLTAAGVFSDGSTHDLTASVTWTASSAAIATVSSGGVVTGTGVGSATIVATQAGVSASTTVTITAATLTAITITPPNSAIASGTSKQLIATGDFSDGTTQNLTAFVTWTSSNPSVAAVSNAADSQGLVTGSGVGGARITATYGGVSGSTLMLVTSATLTGITITPPDPSIAKGTSRQLIATGDFSDGTTQNLTALVTWTSSNQSLVTVSNAVGSRGLVTGTGVGNATVTATLGGVSGSTAVTTTPPVLTSIDIAPPNFSLAKGTSLQLTAIGNFSDGTAEDLTTSVTWISSAPEIAVISNAAGNQGLITGTFVGSAAITAMQAGVSGSTTVMVTPAILTSIVVTAANASIAKGTTVQLTATGTFSDGTTEDLTASASWISTSDAIATVGNTGSPGLVTGTGVGSATISATQAGVHGSATVTVTPAILTSITITPPNRSIAKATTVQLVATGTFSDGTTQDFTASASWISTADAIATVGNTGSSGLVTGTGVGSATITATQAGVSGSATVTVTPAVLISITITPPNPSIALGTTVQLSATGTFSDGTTQDFTASASWISTADAIATVGNTGSSGLVTGTGVGSATITATQAGVSGSATVMVTPAILTSITITPPNPSIALGTTVQLSATGTFSDGTTQDFTASAHWTSTADAIATVGNTGSSGLVTGTGVGSATITATQAGVSGSATVTITAAILTSVTITPPNPSIALGTTVQLSATGTFSDGTTQDFTASAHWTSTADAIATVGNTGSPGLVTGTGVGSATITATQAGVSGSATVTVTPAVLISITITPPNPSIALGTTVQLSATGTFSDGTTQDFTASAHWTSTADAIATVGNTGSPGLVTGTGVGSATITATQAGVSSSTTVTVTPAVLISITITPSNPSIAKGTTVQLSATGTFSDETTQDFTASAHWTSTADAIATVGNTGSSGLVTGTGVGSATITATQAGVSGSATVMVTPAILTSITITPPNPSIALGTTVQLSATGTFSDGTTQDFTASAHWTSTADAIATVGNTGSPGLVTGTGVGSATITATQAGVSGSATVTVTPAILTTIAINPANPSIANGTSVQLSATGTFSDGTTQDLTHSVSWTAIPADTVTVDPNGLLTGTKVGNGQVIAVQGTVVGSTFVTVTPAILTMITITPPNLSIARGTTVQLTATGTFSDGTTQDLTHSVSWTSKCLALVCAAVDPNGLVTGNGVGSTTITALQSGVSGSTTVTVTAAILTSIAITPMNPSIARGTTVQLTAIGTFSDGTTQDLTHSVNWTSTCNLLVCAHVDPSGLVTGTGVGSSTITATESGVSGATTVTVH